MMELTNGRTSTVLRKIRTLNCTLGHASQKGGMPTSPRSAHHSCAFLVVNGTAHTNVEVSHVAMERVILQPATQTGHVCKTRDI